MTSRQGEAANQALNPNEEQPPFTFPNGKAVWLKDGNRLLIFNADGDCLGITGIKQPLTRASVERQAERAVNEAIISQGI